MIDMRRIAASVICAVLLLGGAYLTITAGAGADGWPGRLVFAAIAIAPVLMGMTIPQPYRIARGLLAGSSSLGIWLVAADAWVRADIAREGPMAWEGEARAMIVGFVGLPASLITGVLVFAASWMWARRGGRIV